MTINSPIGRMQAAKPKVLTVPDESDSQGYINNTANTTNEEYMPTHEEIQQLRASKIAAVNRIATPMKDKLELLLNMKRLTIDVDIDGIVFTLRSLKSKEMQEATYADGRVFPKTVDFYYASRLGILARSIYLVDGQAIEYVLRNNSIEAKINFIENLEDSVVEILHDKYLEMTSKNADKFQVSNEEQAEEVSKELKK